MCTAVRRPLDLSAVLVGVLPDGGATVVDVHVVVLHHRRPGCRAATGMLLRAGRRLRNLDVG